MVFSHYAYETPSMGIAVIYRTALGGRMGMLEKRVNVVCGHYGVGKTNLSINLAVDCARDGEEVTLIDMDVVNPYFRSADYAEELEGLGVRVIGPNYASTNLDTPSLPASLPAAIEDGGRVIIDVGGDDAGATALGVYARVLRTADPEVLYVVNRYRSLTSEPEEAVSVMEEVQRASGLRATCIVNNAHLKGETTAETVEASVPFAEEVCRITGLPLRFTAVPRGVRLLNKRLTIYPVDAYVRAPWEQQV